MRTYVFVFLGEFGYELLNWQGCIRKLVNANEEHKIVCCSRKGLNQIYDFADFYIDISDLELYKKSVANGYRGMCPDINCVVHNEEVREGKLSSGIHSFRNYKFVYKLHKQIKEYVKSYLSDEKLDFSFFRFVFSDEFNIIHGVKFGRTFGKSGAIYDTLDYKNNNYAAFGFSEAVFEKIMNELELPKDAPYVLCQMGYRSIVQRSKFSIDPEKILRDISENVRVIVLNFHTGRNYDSGSSYNVGNSNILTYCCKSFVQQSALIGHAKCCVFFTEGDFRSHNYLPPFLGKNVYSVASESVFDLPTTPIEYWNKNVFSFGGQIIPIVYEKLCSDELNYKNFIDVVTK